MEKYHEKFVCMVIGNGMVATAFGGYQNNKGFVIFASGVANSKNTNAADYEREFNLLHDVIKQNKNKTLVYFSTCSVDDPGEADSLYVNHKLQLEHFISQNVSSYHIFRVSNLVGNSTNQNTVLNFFYYHMRNKVNFDVWSNSTRNLIDVDDMFKIVSYALKRKLHVNTIVNVANPISYNVKEIISALESVLKMKANYISIAKGSHFTIDISLIKPIIKELDIDFGENYLLRIIKKYYLGS